MKSRYTSLENTLQKLMKEYDLEESYNKNYLINNWSRIVNQNIAAVTNPVSIENKTITIKVMTESWKKEIAKNEENLIKMINNAVDKFKIEKIVLE